MTTVTENPLSILEAFDNVAKLQLYYFDKATKLPKSYQKILKKLGVKENDATPAFFEQIDEMQDQVAQSEACLGNLKKEVCELQAEAAALLEGIGQEQLKRQTADAEFDEAWDILQEVYRLVCESEDPDIAQTINHELEKSMDRLSMTRRSIIARRETIDCNTSAYPEPPLSPLPLLKRKPIRPSAHGIEVRLPSLKGIQGNKDNLSSESELSDDEDVNDFQLEESEAVDAPTKRINDWLENSVLIDDDDEPMSVGKKYAQWYRDVGLNDNITSNDIAAVVAMRNEDGLDEEQLMHEFNNNGNSAACHDHRTGYKNMALPCSAHEISWKNGFGMPILEENDADYDSNNDDDVIDDDSSVDDHKNDNAVLQVIPNQNENEQDLKNQNKEQIDQLSTQNTKTKSTTESTLFQSAKKRSKSSLAIPDVASNANYAPNFRSRRSEGSGICLNPTLRYEQDSPSFTRARTRSATARLHSPLQEQERTPKASKCSHNIHISGNHSSKILSVHFAENTPAEEVDSNCQHVARSNYQHGADSDPEQFKETTQKVAPLPYERDSDETSSVLSSPTQATNVHRRYMQPDKVEEEYRKRANNQRPRQHDLRKHSCATRRFTCRFCLEVIGRRESHLRCWQCTQHFHPRCVLQQLPANCQPPPFFTKAGKKRGAVRPGFNLQNDVFLEAQRSNCYTLVPRLIEDCVQQIDRRGPMSPGIYRVPGTKSAVEKLRDAYFKEFVFPNLATYAEINDIASLLKLYLRELDEPLLTFDLYKSFECAVKDCDKRTLASIFQALAKVIQELPPINFFTLQYLIRHLKRLSHYADTTNMTRENLAVCFGPSIMWTAFPQQASYSAARTVAEYLIRFPKKMWNELQGERSNLITNVSLDLNKYAKEEKTYKAAKRKHTAATAKEEKKKLKQQKKKK